VIRRMFASSVFRDVAKLVSGTAGGRMILLLAMPVVTRLYSPEHFELLAVYAAMVGTISVAACLRLEIAIPLAETDDDAAHLLAMSLMATAATALALLVLSGAASETIARLVGSPDLSRYVWLVSFGVLFTASYSALQFWATRARRFGAIARTRIGQAATGAATMVGLGFLGLTPVGLLLGNMLSVGAGGLSLALRTMRDDRSKLAVISRRGMAGALRRHRRYPLFSTPEALANTAGIQVPILMIAATADDEAGQLFLAMQIMAAPMTLLGASVGQVYASRAAEEMRNLRLHRFTVSMMRRLFLIGLWPMAAAALLAPAFFAVIFGAEWQRAGVIVAWIAPWMLLQLTVSPVSMGLHISGHQRAAMGLQLIGLVLRVGAVAIGTALSGSIAVESYAVSGAVFYALYGITVLRAVRSR
jgi:O-antigen/teichoic acid export membrane protein